MKTIYRPELTYESPLKSNTHEQLETEKQANELKIEESKKTILEAQRIAKHAIFIEKLNISRLEKANKEIDRTLEALKS